VGLQPGMGPIYVVPLRMTQAITHLLNYALDSADGGAVALHVSEGEMADNRVLILDLSHENAISDADAGKVFDSFRRIATLGGHESGLNLALPLAKPILELH